MNEQRFGFMMGTIDGKLIIFGGIQREQLSIISGVLRCWERPMGDGHTNANCMHESCCIRAEQTDLYLWGGGITLDPALCQSVNVMNTKKIDGRL